MSHPVTILRCFAWGLLVVAALSLFASGSLAIRIGAALHSADAKVTAAFGPGRR